MTVNRGYNKKLELMVIALFDALDACGPPDIVEPPLMMAFLRLQQLDPDWTGLIKRLRHKHRELPRVRLMGNGSPPSAPSSSSAPPEP
jgi:hypothetical protein